ncbi:aldehyde dehydrogenase family protein [Brevibacillus daliensis]|uniref:aldehyde dehydrogenase family protein n=1 Tax=Brevibacillus daliensis TaxID=2892995 RepID=UPI001E35346F|nr:aldehyde dehydrogenase family protein [Brevibacillus daliensis]
MEAKTLENLVKQLVMEKLTESLETKRESIVKSIGSVSGVFDTVDEAVAAAVRAQTEYSGKTLACRRKVVEAIRTGLTPYIEDMAMRAFEETGMGNVNDKIQKNRLAINQTPGVEDLVTDVATGDNGMTLYELSPYGVIGAVAPSTNPSETVICNTIGMLAAGNAVFFSPHPGAKKISLWLIDRLNTIVREACGIDNLVVTVANPSIEAAQEMMNHPKIALLVVTGGPGVVSQAMRSGKKVIGAGAGNPPSIVDETANIEKAASDIVDGASFDHNILCIAEKNVVAVDSIADYLIFNMEKVGALLVRDPEDVSKLEKVAVTPEGHTNKQLVGKSPSEILDAAGITCEFDPRLIIVETDKNHPFAVIELLMPIVPIVRVADFETGLETALELEQGLHHTATMHSQNITRLNKAARQLQTSIFVKNGPSFAGLGFRGEGSTTFTIATPTGEGTTTSRHFAKRRRCVLTDGFSIR